MSDYTFDPMSIKLIHIKTIEKDFGIPFMPFISRIQKADGVDVGTMSISELQAMIYIAGAASGVKTYTVSELDEMTFGELSEMLSSLSLKSEPVNPTIG